MNNRQSPLILFHIFVFLIFSLVLLLLYANTFHSPFVFDDAPNILLNPFIKLQELSWHSLQKAATVSPSSKYRWLPNLSFGLNYYLGGFNVFGFHLFNIIIHVLTAFSFYLLVRTTLDLPAIGLRLQRTGEIALAAALIWAVHPLQTNGVTYIVQRMTSMATLFSLLSLLCYVKARLQVKTRILFFTAALLFAVMAFLSKENSGMLPVMVAGYEIFFLQQPGKNKKILLRISIPLAIFVLVCLLFLGTDPLARILNGYTIRDFTLGQRLLTETRIIFHYLGLLVLPLPARLNLAYDYPLSTGLLSPLLTLPAVIGIIVLVFLVFFFYKRDRLTGFALFWFLGNLVIESSVIPLELVFEHRMYMPSMFLVLAGVTWFYRLNNSRINITRGILLAISLLLCLFTWQRNTVWQNEISLWTDVVHKSPHSMRANGNLGNAYSKAKRYHEAEQYLLKAVSIGHYDQSGNFGSQYMQRYLAKVHDNLGMVYRELNNFPKALVEAKTATELDPSNPGPLLTLGIIYSQKNQHQTAYEYFAAAAGKGLESVDLYNNWAVSSFNLGQADRSINLLKLALALDPEHSESHYNLGIAYGSKGMIEEARREMALAMQLRNRPKK